MKFLRFYVLTLLICVGIENSAQDVLFTQFNTIPIYFNPAFAGSTEQNRVTSTYQRSGPRYVETNAFAFSYDQMSHMLKGGIGITFLYRNENPHLKGFSSSIIYAPKLMLTKRIMLSPALECGYTRSSLDWSKLTFGDQIDTQTGLIHGTDIKLNKHLSYFDLSSGIIINTRNSYMGVSIHHINTPKNSFLEEGSSTLDPKYTILLGTQIKFRKDGDLAFSPSIIYQHQSDSWFQAYTTIQYRKISIGTGFGLHDYRRVISIPITFGYNFKKFRIGYNWLYFLLRSAPIYDIKGIHQISLRYSFNWKDNGR